MIIVWEAAAEWCRGTMQKYWETTTTRSSRGIRASCGSRAGQPRDAIGETVNLTVREGDEVIYIERVTSNRMMRVEQVVGSRAPLHVTAVGKLMLAELGDHFISAYASRTGLKAYTPHTITTEQDLINLVHLDHAQGFAYDNEEAEEGVGCIGVLVYDGSRNVVAGLSISAPIERRKDEWVKLVKDAGRKISERLGA